MKVEFAAADMTERLAPFRAVLEHGGVRDALDRLCAAEWRRGTGQAVRARALKWHGDRCTFEIALRTEEGWHSVIGKVYTGHRSDVFWAMQALGQAGFGPEADFSIAQPFVYRPEDILLDGAQPSSRVLLLDGEGFHASTGVAELLASRGARSSRQAATMPAARSANDVSRAGLPSAAFSLASVAFGSPIRPSVFL